MGHKLIIICALGAILVQCTSGWPYRDAEDAVVCESHDQYIPHPDCRKYYQCVNYIPTERSCATPLYWNPRENNCDYPGNVPECVGHTRPPTGSTTTTERVETTTESPTTEEEPETEQPTTEEPEQPTTEAEGPETEQPTTEEPDQPTTEAEEPETEQPTTAEPEQPTTEQEQDPTTPAPLCHPAGYYTLPIPGNCTAFIICAYGNQYFDVCAEGLKFDPVIRKCMLEEYVDCEDPTQPPEPTTTTTEAPICTDPGYYLKAYPGSCTLYYACTDYIATVLECGWGLVFDPYVLNCVRQEASNCTVPTEPPTQAPPTTPAPSPTTTEDWQQTEPGDGTTPDDEGSQSTTQGGVVTDEPTTTTTTRRPSPRCDPDRYYYIPYDNDNTCMYYIHCNYGIPILLSCAEGTLFNPAVEKCVRSEHYTCPYTTTTTAPTTVAPTTTEAPTTTSRPSTSVTEPEPPQSTTPRFQCPPDPFIYLPHDTYCNLFYLCRNGQYRGEFSCGSDRWFDSRLQDCVPPVDSDCTLEPLP